MMRLAFLSCILFFPLIVLCQKLNYDGYAFPDMNIKGMYLTGNSQYQNDQETSNTYKRFSIKATSGKFTLQNSRRIQRFSRNHFELLYSNSLSTNNGIKDYNDHYSASGTYYNEKRKFKSYQKRSKAVFKEFNQLVDFSVSHTPQLLGKFNVERDVNMYASFPLKIGIGKIEPVAYLNVAEFLAEDLHKEGLIENPMNEDDIFELAEKIVSVTNERVFDRRKAYIYQLTEISDWFYQRNIPTDIKSFSILNDNLRNVNAGIERGHGIQNSIAAEPILLYNNVDDALVGLGLFYTLNIQNYFSKKFHHDFRFKTGIEMLTFENIGGFITMSSGYSLNYTPNSRTLISLLPKADYYFHEYSNTNLIMSCRASLNYFINYNLTLEAYVTGIYTYHSDEIGFDSGYVPYTLRYNAFDPVFYRSFNNYRPYYFNASGPTNYIFGNISLNYYLF